MGGTGMVVEVVEVAVEVAVKVGRGGGLLRVGLQGISTSIHTRGRPNRNNAI